MEKYEVIFRKLDELKEKNEVEFIYKVIEKNSENIQELTKLSYEINNPQPLTYSFS
ncbi:hypothetical protein [Bacillus yapensis]|uniref:hypothetical protein n=1 Tax=Bacillus yapensis TaxID=2492960 RepID=UPI00148546FC|nr:hypothetical protein [Bacillus yapensis]